MPTTSKIQTRLLWLVLSVVLPFGALLLWLQTQNERAAQDAVYARLMGIATGRAALTARYFEDQKDVLARIAQRPGIRLLDPSQCDAIIKTYPELHPEFTNLTLRRPNGDLICSLLPQAVKQMRPDALKAFGFGPDAPPQSTSNVFTGPTSGRKLIGTTQQVQPASGGEAGYLLLGNDLLKLNERIFAGLPPDVTIGIFDRTETIAFRSREPEKWIGQPLAPANRGRYNQQPDGQAVITAVDGVRRMYAWTTIPGLGWRVSTGVVETEAMGSYWQARNFTAGAVALLLLAAVALAYRLAQSINRPIRQLAGATQRMAEGDFSARAAVSGPRELRALATQFNAMLETRAQALADLSESETRWKFAIEGAGDGLWDWDVAAGTVYFSPRWKAMLGHTEDEVGNALTEWSSRVHPDDMAAVMADLQPHLDGSTAQYANEHRVLCKDGSYKWILDRGLVVARDAAGKPLRVVGTHSDITERKQSQETLRSTERRFRDLMDSTDGIVWEADAVTFTFESISANAERMLGYPLADWLKPGFWASHIHPDDHDYAVQYCVACTGRLENHDFEYRFITADGRTVWLRDIVKVVSEDGKPRWLRGLMIDVTQAYETAETLRTNSDLLEYTQAAAKVGGWELTLATGHLYWTAETYRIHEANPAEFNPTVDAGVSYFLPDSRAQITEALGRAVGQGLGYALELQTYTTKGKLIDVFTTCTVSLKEGKPAKLTGIFQDITAQKAAQRSIEAANLELARSNSDLEQFAYVASHDLQEPLRSVSSSVQLLRRRYEGALDARAQEFIAHAVGGVQRMQAVIDDLLAYSRVASGPRVLKSADLEAAFQGALENLSRSIAASHATITHDPLPTLLANPLQIGQVLQNLIGNALKFRGDKPAVVHVGAVNLGTEWQFSVADQGIGIAPEYFERVFKLFQRLHTRTEYEGTGIGLTICHKIVERHGGRIWVESGVGSGSGSGQGSTFFFTLPITEAA